MNHLTAGALAGLLSTVPMSATMLLLRRAWPETRRAPLPPGVVTERLAEAADVRDDLGDTGVRAATVADHVAYGAAAGVLYAAVAGRTTAPAATGVAFGLAR